MIFSNVDLPLLVIVVLAVCGFLISRHIHNHKVKNTPLVCPVRFDCHAVVHSDYSRFFGMPVETLGMIYYVSTGVFYFFIVLCNVFMPEPPESLVFLLLPVATLFWLLSLAAFLFSLYLIAIQIFVLRKGCSWCIVSALISTLIFILVFFA